MCMVVHICILNLTFLTKDVICTCTSIYHEYKDSLAIFLNYTEKMIYNVFGIWNWNIQLVRFLVYIICCFQIKYETLWIPKIYIPLEWVKHISHWSRHMKLLIYGLVVEMIYEYMWFYSCQHVPGRVFFYYQYGWLWDDRIFLLCL